MTDPGGRSGQHSPGGSPVTGPGGRSGQHSPGGSPVTGAAPFTALVVDDAPDIRLLAELVLSMAGFKVATASSGREALHRLAHCDLPDIVLLDVQMPEVDGWETLSRLRSDRRTAELPVVLCTVKGLPEDTLKGWTLGCDGYLGKPFDIGGLVDELQGVLRRDADQRGALRRLRVAELARAAR